MKKVWVETYRPKSVDKVILTDTRTRKIFESYIKAGEFPNLLLYGPPGTGKSSMSRALLRDLNVSKLDVLRINCSDEKIEALRDKVSGFATTMPIGNFKVVQLEEFDGLGQDAQKLLRALIEDTSSSCRFIATCNYINKIIPALRSRFTQEFALAAPSRDDVLLLAAEILDAEGVAFDLDDLEKIVAAAYPDIRKTIQLLEGSSTSGKLSLVKTEGVSDWKLQLLPLLEKNDWKAARKVVCESATVNELLDIYRFLYDNIGRTKMKRIDDAIVEIADFQRYHEWVGDKEVHIAALFIKLGALT